MTIQECYSHMGADYEDVLRRLDKEDRILRFLHLFLKDGSYAALSAAFAAGDGTAAFRAAHSLKGVCLNLGLTALYGSANALTEELRDEKITPVIGQLFDGVTAEYQTVIESIEELLRP